MNSFIIAVHRHNTLPPPRDRRGRGWSGPLCSLSACCALSHLACLAARFVRSSGLSSGYSNIPHYSIWRVLQTTQRGASTEREHERERARSEYTHDSLHNLTK